ncbi:MAG: hypothetical protein FRX48_09654 [Lasallia pustulata]|uniref:Uncharacterized protein n=1 Tax=Lasallia pustulata TaxID=136370 RepID=A0A5M8PBC2_9LECA|nr:MAG: hypothetical protein FRX48_09654 [Lasallia pustulata]
MGWGRGGGEVRRGSGRVGKVVGRDRRGLRARRRGLQRDARTGGGGGGNRERGRENEDDDGGRESEDDEGWEEKVVEAYQGWETEEESEESMDGRRGSEGFALGDGDEGKARFVGAADESGDAERRAEEYRMLLGPRPELGTPGSSSVSVRRGPGSAPRTGQMESDVAERRETTSQKARATRRSHR